MPLNPPQAYRKTFYTHRRGTRAAQPAAADVLPGTLYFVTDELITERSTGAAWQSYSSSAVPTFTTGSVIFAGATGALAQDNANFFWDDTNNRLGIGTATPGTDFVVSHGSIGSQPVTNSSTNPAIGFRLINPTAALVGAQSQASPAIEFVTSVWDVDSAVARTPRIGIWASVVAGNTPDAYLSFRYDQGQGVGWLTSDDLRAGRVIAGGGFDFRIADGNIIFKNSARGIYFTGSPLTDSTPASHYIAPSTTGRIDLIPLNAGSEGYVNLEYNQFGSTTGTIPVLNIRPFDNSTSTPTLATRVRAIPGGTAANGYGSRHLSQASSSTTSNQDQGAFDCVWSDATHATRTAKYNFYLVNSAAALALKFEMLASGVFYTSAATFMIGSRTSYNNGAGAGAGTLTNAPAAGDPTKWIPIDDNGTTRYIPAW